ncbi:BON domain-containing protein [Geomonas sp. RF6]|uniref:BON domain-containing protein n=1 Tax=Geomonas sp. RF6 TaxID=2897342 RepID=UPI001E3B3C0B|nr:BON domain-containing protein [Geomonas sp. RF6]UFS69051.1 BON domain-containing protein [Geomonas sp. RF6]
MPTDQEIVEAVYAALERSPQVNLHSYPMEVACRDGVVTIAGEVEGIAAKKVALEVAAASPGASGVVDRVRVEPAEHMEDGEIRTHICDALLEEPAFDEYSVKAMVKGEWEPVRVTKGEYFFEVEVNQGVLVLNGKVQSISHKRLAGVLAWWVPGSRDVVNGLEIYPPMSDSDDEIVDAVLLVLEKDPFVNASQIRISCRNAIVTLDGTVALERGRDVAEADAWYVFAVNGVVNNLVVTG